MVTIRLSRSGAKKRPFYRLVAAPQQSPRDGRFIEQLGYYDPMQEPLVLKLDLDRIDHWISVGAKPSDTAGKLIERYRKLSNEMAAAASATSEG
jgi:small subunit ribosomal protein S16